MDQLLKEICLEGFKSFRDRTVLRFDGPFTAIVGPNGSGKSNVVDAVKWVLGDQSPRSIRAATGLEAIYRPADGNGSDSTGFASVLIKIDNSEPESPDEPAIYEIERRYYRSGESVYAVNGKSARLKDVRAIMARKGFGLGSLSVVSQGEIDGFLSLVPADRRLVFEDLARIGDFKANKRKILGQLDDSARNLQRLQDLIGEIGLRAEELTVQAAAARRHAELSASRQDLRAQLAAQEYLLARRNVERHESRLKEIEEELEKATSHQTELGRGVISAKHDIEQARKDSAAILARCEEGRRELDLAKAEERRLTDAGGHLATLIHALEEELQERENRLLGIRSRKEELTGIIARADEDRAEAHRRKLEHELYLSHRWGYMRSCERERERLASKVERLTGESSLFARDAEFHNRRAESLKAESETHRRKKAELEGSIRKLEVDEIELAGTHEELVRLKNEKESSLAACVERLTNLRERSKSVEQNRSKVVSEIAGLEREHAVLSELEAAREGYNEGVKAILARRDEFAGLRGSLGELVKPEQGREQVIERALGEALQFLICDSLADALGIVEVSRREQLGTVTCLICDLIPDIPGRGIETGDLMGYCSIDSDLQPVLALLLNGAREIDRLEADSAAILSGVLITSDGDVFRAPAFLSGGMHGTAPGILSRRARLEELSALLAENRDASTHLADEAAGLAEEITGLEGEEHQLRWTLEEARDKLKTSEIARQRHSENRAQMDRDLDAVEKRIHELETECAGCMESARMAAASVESTRRVRLDAESDLGRLEGDIPGLHAEVEDLRTRVQRAIVEEASYREESERAHAEIERLEVEIAGVNEETNRKKNRLDEVRRDAQSTSHELKEAAAHRQTLEARLPELEAGERIASERIENLSRAVAEAEEKLEAGRQEVTRLEGTLHTQELRVAELRGGLTGLERDLGAFPEFAERIRSGEMSGREIPSKKELTESLDEVEAALVELGDVNPLAIEEEQHAKARLGELQTERDDLNKAEEELRQALEEIERESKKAFVSTFDEARERFAEVFAALFEGGSAELRLTNPDDPLESGIDVRVKFPDKGQLDLIQFSGGERALIALALLFAILKVKPSSFTLLDEVEAALDDVNTQKFLDYLGQEFPDRQFILITHNKITMERADRLYGVTMREAGVSQVVSVDLKKLKEEGIEEVLGAPRN